MSIYLELLKTAFNEVDTSYYSFYAFHFSDRQYQIDPKKMKKYEQFLERNLAYELYHRYRLIMQSKHYSANFHDLQLNGEVNKIGFNDTVINQNVIIPDLVLHKSQSNLDPDYQKLFVEIKVNPKASLKKDIRKLLFAISSPLYFQEAVLVCVNMPFEEAKKQVKDFDYLGSNNEDLKKIFLLHPNESISFYEIVNNE